MVEDAIHLLVRFHRNENGFHEFDQLILRLSCMLWEDGRDANEAG